MARHLAVGLALLAACGCSEDGLSASRASELVAPHLDHFARFDRWARRALQADPAFRSRESIEETVFAPVRREEPVMAIWITRRSPDRRLVFGHLEALPKRLEWVRVRDGAIGDIDVTTAKVPDPRRRFREGEGERAVLMRRSRAGSDGAEVAVTVAYRVVPAEGE